MVSINADTEGVCGLMLNIDYGTASPPHAPALFLGVSPTSLAAPFKDALYGSFTPVDPSSGLPLLQQKRIAIVHAEPVDGPADVIRLTFQVPSSVADGTVYRITASPSAYDAFGVNIPMAPLSASITALRPGSTVPVSGDVDGDGRVTVSDVLLILRATLGLTSLDEARSRRADLTHNGRLDVADAVADLRIAAGLPP
jgi:hypothetical protein